MKDQMLSCLAVLSQLQLNKLSLALPFARLAYEDERVPLKIAYPPGSSAVQKTSFRQAIHHNSETDSVVWDVTKDRRKGKKVYLGVMEEFKPLVTATGVEAEHVKKIEEAVITSPVTTVLQLAIVIYLYQREAVQLCRVVQALSSRYKMAYARTPLERPVKLLCVDKEGSPLLKVKSMRNGRHLYSLTSAGETFIESFMCSLQKG